MKLWERGKGVYPQPCSIRAQSPRSRGERQCGDEGIEYPFILSPHPCARISVPKVKGGAKRGLNGACTEAVGELKDRVNEKDGMACSETWVPFDSVCQLLDGVDLSSDSDGRVRRVVCYSPSPQKQEWADNWNLFGGVWESRGTW